MNKKIIIPVVVIILNLFLISGFANAADDTNLTGTSTVTSGSSTSIKFDNPLNYDSVSSVLSKLLSNLKSTVIVIAIIFIIIGGLMYMMSGGNEKTITRAKACVAGAIIGLAIVLAAPVFLNEIVEIFGGSSEYSTGSGTRLSDIAENVLEFLLSILGIVAIISLVISGIMYLTAYGDEKKIETAKTIAKYAVIGIVVSLAALILVKQVASLLGESVSSSSSSTTTSLSDDLPAGYTSL